MIPPRSSGTPTLKVEVAWRLVTPRSIASLYKLTLASLENGNSNVLRQPVDHPLVGHGEQAAVSRGPMGPDSDHMAAIRPRSISDAVAERDAHALGPASELSICDLRQQLYADFEER